MNKGYDYDEAATLMAPKIQMYRMQEANDELARAYLAFRQCDNLD